MVINSKLSASEWRMIAIKFLSLFGQLAIRKGSRRAFERQDSAEKDPSETSQ